MSLPLVPPVAPQLARPAPELPADAGWWFEPKWDGFRVLAFVDGHAQVLQSRNGRPLDRYFPELAFPAGRYVLDGEVVIPAGEGVDFDALQQRIHPAASRVAMLAERIPATFVAFDLLARDDDVLLERPFAERRAFLAELLPQPLPRLTRTPGTSSADEAQVWLHQAEGVVAKREDAPYRPGERTGMLKIRRRRTLDAVVMGWRPGKAGEDTVGSLILGLHEPDGTLRPVGHIAGFRAAQKRELRELVRPLETGERGAGEASRWSAGRDLAWVALRPELVVEVAIDHVSGGRIRHGARLLRIRTDRDAASCRVDQLDA